MYLVAGCLSFFTSFVCLTLGSWRTDGVYQSCLTGNSCMWGLMRTSKMKICKLYKQNNELKEDKKLHRVQQLCVILRAVTNYYFHSWLISVIHYLVYNMSENSETFISPFPRTQGDVFRELYLSDHQCEIQHFQWKWKVKGAYSLHLNTSLMKWLSKYIYVIYIFM